MKLLLHSTLAILLFSLSERQYGQEIDIYSFEQLSPLLHKNNDTVYLVNFWATWCVPCIKELPAIEKLAEKNQGEKFKVILVSLDMPGQLNTRLIPFIQKHQIKSEVILLNDPDFNQWIDKVNKNWNGSIPASLIYKNGHRAFYEQDFKLNELENIVEPLIKSK